ncbi:murein biosynthesis integral membrane protein MurJ [bacterium]|nr:MAG: murein biosynthesis integral membrane protein MurJ [bacterium]
MVKLYRFFSRFEQNFHLGRATIIIAVLTLLSRIFGFMRDLLLAKNLGLSSQTDIYFSAFRVPDLIYNLLILGTLSAAFIPVFTKYYLKDKNEAWKIANSVLNIAVVGVGALSVVVFVLAKPLTKIIAPGFEGPEFDQTVALTRILLLSPIIFTVSNVFSSTLLSFKKFIWVNTAPLLYNLGILMGILFLHPHFGLKGIAAGVIAGALMHALIQLPQLIQLGWSWRPKWDWKNAGVQQIVKLFIPRVLGLDISYVNLVIVTIIGSTLATGTIAAYNFANNIQAVPLGIFAISTALAVFPVLSEEYAKKELNSFINTFNRAFVRIVYLILPVSIMLLLLRAYIVRLLLGYGKCDWTCTITTFDTLGVLSLSLIAQSLIPLLSRAFYARQNTRIPVFIGLAAMLINAGLSYTLSFGLGILGVALGFVVASMFQLLFLIIYLHRGLQHDLRNQKIIRESDYYIVFNCSKILVSALITGCVAYGLLYLFALIFDTHTIAGIFLQTGLSSIIAGLVYLLLTAWMGVPDAARIKTTLNRMASFFNVSA